MSRRTIARLGLLALLGGLTALPACTCELRQQMFGSDDRPKDRPDAAQRIRFESTSAPYTVELPSGWSATSASELNRHADLAATKSERLFLIVIPQKLPAVDAVDVEALKEASLARMRTNIEKLRIEREGPVTLPKGEGLSVFVEGVADGHPVQYVATFVTHRRWGYQIVAWGPANAEDELIDSVDALVGGWQFHSDSLRSPSADSGPSETSNSETD